MRRPVVATESRAPSVVSDGRKAAGSLETGEPDRRAWTGAAIRAGALLVVPFVTWMAFSPPGLSSKSATALPGAQEQRPNGPLATGSAAAATRRTPRPALAPKGDDLEGEVNDLEGKPVAGASVTCVVGGRELGADTDETGRFRLGAEAEGCAATAQRQGFAPSEVTTLRAGKGNQLRLAPTSGIAGNVVDEGGGPVMSYWVALAPSMDGVDAGASLAPKLLREVNDVNGAFELSDVAPGRYTIAVRAHPNPLARVHGIEVAAGTITRGVRIVVKHGATVIGTITDAVTNQPVSGAMVFTDRTAEMGLPAMPTFNAKGEFRLENAPREPFTLHVLHPGYMEHVTRDVRATTDGPPLRIQVALQRPIRSPAPSR